MTNHAHSPPSLRHAFTLDLHFSSETWHYCTTMWWLFFFLLTSCSEVFCTEGEWRLQQGMCQEQSSRKTQLSCEGWRICLLARTRFCSQNKAMDIRGKVKANKPFFHSNMSSGTRCISVIRYHCTHLHIMSMILCDKVISTPWKVLMLRNGWDRKSCGRSLTSGLPNQRREEKKSSKEHTYSNILR